MAENMNDKRLHYLHDLDDYKIAKGYPDITGWKVVDTERKKIGEVESLLVDVVAEKVRYLDVDLDADILHDAHDPFEKPHKDGIHEYENRKGETHMIIPIGVARIDRNAKMVVADGVNRDALVNAPTHLKGSEITRDYEIGVVSSYRGKGKYEEDEKIRMKDDYFYDQDCFDDACLYDDEGQLKNRRDY